MNPPLLSKVKFGSLLTYAAHSEEDLAKQSVKKVRDPAKRCDPRFVERFCEILIDHLNDRGELNQLFERENLTLVPIPRSAPLPPKNLSSGQTLWPSLYFCQAMQAKGVKCNIEPCLERVVKIRKSAFASPGERAEPMEHFNTMTLDRATLTLGREILLVDDFITRGSTIVGAASLIKNRHPNANVSAFTVVRTVYARELKRLIEPCVGEISFEDGRLSRAP